MKYTENDKDKIDNNETPEIKNDYIGKKEGEENFFTLERPTEEKMSFRKRWAIMDSEERKKYFKDYMLIPLIIGVIVAVILIRMGIKIYKNAGVDRYVISATYEEYIDRTKLEEHAKELREKWGLGKREYIGINMPIGVPDGKGTAMVQGSKLFDNYMFAGKLDAVMGIQSEIECYAYLYEDFNKYIDPAILERIPKEAFVTLKSISGDPDDYSGEIYEFCCAFKVKYTVLADVIKEDYISADELLIVLPVTDHNTGRDEKDKEFVKYLFGIE